MSNRTTARWARYTLALCLAAVPAWNAIAPDSLGADRVAAHELMRGATKLFGPGRWSNGKKMGRPVPLGLRN